MKTKNAKVTEIIYDLLVNDKVARTDDIYLYGKVIKALVPGLLDKSFGDVLMNHFDNGFIHLKLLGEQGQLFKVSIPNLLMKLHIRSVRNSRRDTLKILLLVKRKVKI